LPWRATAPLPLAASHSPSAQITLAPGALGAAARSALSRVTAFKDVTAERRLTRHLSSAAEAAASAPPPPPPPSLGRRQTRPTFGMEPAGWSGEGGASREPTGRALLQGGVVGANELGASRVWGDGFTGKGVRVAVFDTGVRADHPAFRRIRERTNWTSEQSLDDGLGHGSFVAGVILGMDPGCPGFAPDAELLTFRVFTTAQLSYTSWFLDAFNYAMAVGVDVLNLSIGGPDYLDAPFVEKVWEVTGSGIVMVSAIGNDGPLFGTLNNPADNMDVIGVGGIDSSKGSISGFSSRGMTTAELPLGMGRFKPDIVTFGRDVLGPRIEGGCRPLSGTSVASPVVAGAVALLVSTVPAAKRRTHVNPASLKQVLVEGAERLERPVITEQGAGQLSLANSYALLKEYSPRASALPARLALDDEPYMFPFCKQGLYAAAQPVIVNVTLLNGLHVTGWLEAPPVFHPATAAGDLGKHLDVSFTYSRRLWPWSGWLGVHIRVAPAAAALSGLASGSINLTIASPGGLRSAVSIPLRAQVVPTPPRARRLLWSSWHNVPYPPGYIPRDNLDMRQDILDWHGDHLGTNYHDAFSALRAAGWFVELLREPMTCFNASSYGTLMLVDTEEEFTAEEVEKLQRDVRQGGLGLLVFAEWYHVPTMVGMRFFDDNTHSYWTPLTGGANVPALNDLLAPFCCALGDRVMKGSVSLGGRTTPYSSGANIARWPAGGSVVRAPGLVDATGSNGGWASAGSGVEGAAEGTGVLGLLEAGAGRLAVWGDSNCLDSSHAQGDCFWLADLLLQFTGEAKRVPALFPRDSLLAANLSTAEPLPLRRTDVDFAAVSKVSGSKWAGCVAGPGRSDTAAQGEGGEAGEAAVAATAPPAEQPPAEQPPSPAPPPPTQPPPLPQPAPAAAPAPLQPPPADAPSAVPAPLLPPPPAEAPAAVTAASQTPRQSAAEAAKLVPGVTGAFGGGGLAQHLPFVAAAEGVDPATATLVGGGLLVLATALGCAQRSRRRRRAGAASAQASANFVFAGLTEKTEKRT